MNYLQQFKDILIHIVKEDKSQNQILSDLHLLLELINEELSYLHNGYQKLLSEDGEISINSLELFRATEYNNALMLSMLRPPNIIEILNKVLIEKRYYFFFTVTDILSNADIEKKLKSKLENMQGVVRNKLNLPQLDVKYSELETIQDITQRLFNGATGDWESWEKATKEVISELIGSEKVTSTDINRKIKFEEIIKLKNQLELKF